MKYRYLADSIDGVLQLLAASYLRHGYYWYVTGHLPPGKSALDVDRKLIDKYGIDISERDRSRRKKQGLANAHYVRFEDWFILIITEGHHPIRRPCQEGGEGDHLNDCRRIPIRFRGYSISYRRSGVTSVGSIQPKWHAHVRIDRPTYSALKARLEQLAMHRTAEKLATEFARTEFIPYAPIRRQLLNILRSVNSLRQRQGFDLLPTSVLRLRRRPVKVFRERQATSEVACQAEAELSSTEGPCK